MVQGRSQGKTSLRASNLLGASVCIASWFWVGGLGFGCVVASAKAEGGICAKYTDAADAGVSEEKLVSPKCSDAMDAGALGTLGMGRV